MYLWHILSRPEEELIARVYKAQQLKPVKQDHYLRIAEEKQRYSIELDDQEIARMSKLQFKKYVNNAVEKYAYKKLLSTAISQKKCKYIVDSLDGDNFKIQKYLISEDLVKEEQILLFALRSRTFPVKGNFSYIFKDNRLAEPVMIQTAEKMKNT